MAKRKRQIAAILMWIMALILFGGCSPETPSHAVGVGKEKVIFKNDTVKVVSADITDGRITLVLYLDFAEICFEDLINVGVSKAEENAPFVTYNREETQKHNPENIFSAPYTGEVTLIFTHERFSAGHQGGSYCFFLTCPDENGTGSSIRFTLG